MGAQGVPLRERRGRGGRGRGALVPYRQQVRKGVLSAVLRKDRLGVVAEVQDVVCTEVVEVVQRGLGVEAKEMEPEAEKRYIEGVDLFLSGKYQQALDIWKELEKQYPYNKKLQDAIKSAEDRLKRTR